MPAPSVACAVGVDPREPHVMLSHLRIDCLAFVFPMHRLCLQRISYQSRFGSDPLASPSHRPFQEAIDDPFLLPANLLDQLSPVALSTQRYGIIFPSVLRIGNGNLVLIRGRPRLGGPSASGRRSYPAWSAPAHEVVRGGEQLGRDLFEGVTLHPRRCGHGPAYWSARREAALGLRSRRVGVSSSRGRRTHGMRARHRGAPC